MPSPDVPTPRWCVLGTIPGGRVSLVWLSLDGAELGRDDVERAQLPELVTRLEAETAGLRWVFSDAPHWYPRLVAAGITLSRCHDLRLCHAVLRDAASVTERAELAADTRWDAGPSDIAGPELVTALFDYDAGPSAHTVPHDLDSALDEFRRQRAAVASSSRPGALHLLLAAESAGALAAVEMSAAGTPWDVVEHQRILTEALGPRPAAGHKPAKMLELAEQVRAALNAPQLSIDSPTQLLRALHRAGLSVDSTSKWELEEQEHPVIEPLLEYKKLARLLSANGWAWLDEWVREGRYHPVYVPGGVVTGRWAAAGGGALQLPRLLRPALRSDPGWVLVSADVAQLEPRVLAAMAGDRAMAQAGWRRDLYAGIVEQNIVATRQEAKIGMLGALYGGTTGVSGTVVPQLRKVFPAAMRVVDEAARTGENGGIVSTWWGRSSPAPSPGWRRLHDRASDIEASPSDERAARNAARTQGRFTRNFVVQGTAAEWALSWIADLRLRLARLDPVTDGPRATASGLAFQNRPHLVFFLHDEVIVHTPEALAEEAAEAVRDAAVAAGRLLFGGAPVDFPLDVQIAERAVKE
ncbi:bifunctional 3'-5' exonuclease/DNA polymerase [Citricoccus muralis]|uniref:DNA-directed DNA polymerase n=1 Tax=Citricoccus muralis TaxID=169134 RepID=A0ABY8H7V2_9MICC|nr:bifunctional 3'-5' exonuclease/DNA polymerase [Citricoccus muralis]WFP16697.1 bifunctional 3'-5' exonuclease/DNA polymerase [Citricoccus muralis]